MAQLRGRSNKLCKDGFKFGGLHETADEHVEAFFVVVEIAGVDEDAGAFHHPDDEIFIGAGMGAGFGGLAEVFDFCEKMEAARWLYEADILTFAEDADGGLAAFLDAGFESLQEIFTFFHDDREHGLAHLVAGEKRVDREFEVFQIFSGAGAGGDYPTEFEAWEREGFGDPVEGEEVDGGGG